MPSPHENHSADAAQDELILVDEHDNAVGFETKLRAHEAGGKLHRAFSVFIFNRAGEMLLQRRAVTKYHFGGLWTNACCSHPRRGEETLDAAHLRLRHELGFDTDLRELFASVYRAEDPTSGLTEHEFDHVFVGEFDGMPRPNPDEVGEWKWVSPVGLIADVRANPQSYTPWFSLVVGRVLAEC
jgi:isopentenyl-diphosphate delta-isomerase